MQDLLKARPTICTSWDVLPRHSGQPIRNPAGPVRASTLALKLTTAPTPAQNRTGLLVVVRKLAHRRLPPEELATDPPPEKSDHFLGAIWPLPQTTRLWPSPLPEDLSPPAFLPFFVMVDTCVGGLLSWWASVLVGTCPGGRVSWWADVLVGAVPVGRCCVLDKCRGLVTCHGMVTCCGMVTWVGLSGGLVGLSDGWVGGSHGWVGGHTGGLVVTRVGWSHGWVGCWSCGWGQTGRLVIWSCGFVMFVM